MGGLFGAYTTPGVETGGWAPKGFRTENGSHKNLGKQYKLKETKSPTYPPRTKRNVLDSDGTLWFGSIHSPGAALTIRLCHRHKRPVKRIRYSQENRRSPMREIPGIVKWIRHNNITTLNVAGNRESKNPGITMYTEAVISKLLKTLLELK